MAKLFSPTVARWYHISHANLNSFDVHLLPLQPSNDFVCKNRARAAGHIALSLAAPDAQRCGMANLWHSLAEYDFTDTWSCQWHCLSNGSVPVVDFVPGRFVIVEPLALCEAVPIAALGAAPVSALGDADPGPQGGDAAEAGGQEFELLEGDEDELAEDLRQVMEGMESAEAATALDAAASSRAPLETPGEVEDAAGGFSSEEDVGVALARFEAEARPASPGAAGDSEDNMPLSALVPQPRGSPGAASAAPPRPQPKPAPPLPAPAAAPPPPAPLAAARRRAPQYSGHREAHMTWEVPGLGWLKLDTKNHYLAAHCRAPGHGMTCRLNRSVLSSGQPSRQHQGRPFGLLIAWLRAGASFTGPGAAKAHHEMSTRLWAPGEEALCFERRAAARAWAEEQGGLATLFEFNVERPPRAGEGPEPDGLAF